MLWSHPVRFVETPATATFILHVWPDREHTGQNHSTFRATPLSQSIPHFLELCFYFSSCIFIIIAVVWDIY